MTAAILFNFMILSEVVLYILNWIFFKSDTIFYKMCEAHEFI